MNISRWLPFPSEGITARNPPNDEFMNNDWGYQFTMPSNKNKTTHPRKVSYLYLFWHSLLFSDTIIWLVQISFMANSKTYYYSIISPPQDHVAEYSFTNIPILLVQSILLLKKKLATAIYSF